MDVLDKYKDAWNQQPDNSPKISKVDIYKLMHKKSSSIVKWIFIIGILEFLILNSTYLFIDFNEAAQVYRDMGLIHFAYIFQTITYIIVAYFLYLFYKNYKTISVTDTTKQLMDDIIKTRKAVRNYVLFNISSGLLLFVVIMIASVKNLEVSLKMPEMIGITIGIIIVAGILLLLFWLFYQVLYGFLLKKLKRNYKELSKIDALN